MCKMPSLISSRESIVMIHKYLTNKNCARKTKSMTKGENSEKHLYHQIFTEVITDLSTNPKKRNFPTFSVCFSVDNYQLIVVDHTMSNCKVAFYRRTNPHKNKEDTSIPDALMNINR